MTGAPTPPAVTFDDVERAASRLAGVAHRTPVLSSRTLDDLLGASIHLKAEHLQRVGAFKFRGAYNAIAALDDARRARGVVAFSSGNHAQAVALASRLHGVPATIVMPDDAPPVKVAATRGYGARIVSYDRYTEDRRAIGEAVAAETGATVVPPFDHPDVVAGQGTVALELCQDVPDLDLLVAPIGGGGLLAGCTVAARHLHGDLEVIGVEPAGRRAARDALAAGGPVEVEVPRTLLDGQQTTEIGRLPYAILADHHAEVVGVEDEAVLEAMRWAATRANQVLEPSGAAALAALLDGTIDVRDRRVGVVLSGGNVAPEVLIRALSAT